MQVAIRKRVLITFLLRPSSCEFHSLTLQDRSPASHSRGSFQASMVDAPKKSVCSLAYTLAFWLHICVESNHAEGAALANHTGGYVRGGTYGAWAGGTRTQGRIVLGRRYQIYDQLIYCLSMASAATPHVGQGTEDNCSGVSSLFFIRIECDNTQPRNRSVLNIVRPFGRAFLCCMELRNSMTR